MTATMGAEEASIPSMHADENPRLPMRWMQRSRLSRCASSRTVAAVPSGESSSTKIISQSTPGRAAATRFLSSATFPASLKVGTTMDN